MYEYKLSAKYDGKAKNVFCQYDAATIKKFYACDVTLTNGDIIAVRTEFLRPVYDKVQRKIE
jgi:hypothetical protein